MTTTIQQDFINLAIRCEALCFGQFTLKSGRVSPYFFKQFRAALRKTIGGFGY